MVMLAVIVRNESGVVSRYQKSSASRCVRRVPASYDNHIASVASITRGFVQFGYSCSYSMSNCVGCRGFRGANLTYRTVSGEHRRADWGTRIICVSYSVYGIEAAMLDHSETSFAGRSP